VRHLFGKESFDPEETFDTLISCDKCLGLEETPSDGALSGRVFALSNEVKNLKVALANLTDDIRELNATVSGTPAMSTFAASVPVAPMNRELRQQLRARHADADAEESTAEANDEGAAPQRRPRHISHFMQPRQYAAPDEDVEEEPTALSVTDNGNDNEVAVVEGDSDDADQAVEGDSDDAGQVEEDDSDGAD